MSRLRSDAGSIAPLVPVLALGLLLLGGLVIDASRLLNARGRAVAYAEEAARAGAGAIRAGQSVLQLDEPTVRSRVDAFCRELTTDVAQALGGGVRECAYVAPLLPVSDTDRREIVVAVRVRVEIPASLLGMVGVDVLTASGEGRARPFEGVDRTDLDSSPPPADDILPEAPGPLPTRVEVTNAPLPPLPTPTPTPTPTTTPVPTTTPATGTVTSR